MWFTNDIKKSKCGLPCMIDHAMNVLAMFDFLLDFGGFIDRTQRKTKCLAPLSVLIICYEFLQYLSIVRYIFIEVYRQK